MLRGKVVFKIVGEDGFNKKEGCNQETKTDLVFNPSKIIDTHKSVE